MITQVFEYLYRSPLPKGKELQEHDFTQIIDLTCRERSTIKRYCLKKNISYKKIPLNEHIVEHARINEILNLITSDQRTLVHCWGGRHRTGLICALVQERANIPIPNILHDLFAHGFGDPRNHQVYFDYLLTRLYAD